MSHFVKQFLAPLMWVVWIYRKADINAKLDMQGICWRVCLWREKRTKSEKWGPSYLCVGLTFVKKRWMGGLSVKCLILQCRMFPQADGGHWVSYPPEGSSILQKPTFTGIPAMLSHWLGATMRKAFSQCDTVLEPGRKLSGLPINPGIYNCVFCTFSGS